MASTVISKNGIPVRLPDERWEHIAEQHGELEGMRQAVLDTVAEPERILAGGAGELLAVRALEVDKWLIVVYRELQDDGFIITAFFTSQVRFFEQEAAAMAVMDFRDYLKFLPAVKQVPHQAVWLSYDSEGDVLYVNFKKPSRATDSRLTDDDVIIRYEGEEIVGFTILHASQR